MKRQLVLSSIIIALSLIPLSQAVASTVSMEFGTGGGGNSQLGASKSYVYNFGITAAGDGLELDQIVLGIG